MKEKKWPLLMDDLQASLMDKEAFVSLEHYQRITGAFLELLERDQHTKIISPAYKHYIFYQYDEKLGNRITRPLNTNLFISDAQKFEEAFEQFGNLLIELRSKEGKINNDPAYKKYLEDGELNKVVYTMQQSIGCIGDSFSNSNQSRKRIGMLFEGLIKAIIHSLGLECESRTINVPIKGHDGYKMSYELDLVFSRDRAILTSESKFIHESEVIGSVKTTSKDRIDKIFLDKYLLSKLLGREVPVVAIFLHDVQRARRGESIFGVNSTFKTNHFLGYTVALNPLDGVYFVDPRPEMHTNERLSDQIKAFQFFITNDVWKLSSNLSSG